jgi:membrane protein
VSKLTQTLIDRCPDRLRDPLKVAIRTVEGMIGDRLPGLAAEIAFWALLSLPSLLLTAIAAASLFIEGQAWEDQLVNRVAEVASVALTDATISTVVVPVLEQLLEGGGIGLVSFAFLAAVWTASRAVRVVLTTIAIVSSRGTKRPAWKERLIGFAVTLATLAIGSVLAPLLVAGPNFGDRLVAWVGTDLVVLADIWRRAYWPSVIILATLVLALLYHLGIPGHSRWRRDWPGAVLATTVWLAGSAALRLYGIWILDGDSVYGPLAGPIVALLWLWLTGFAVLLGAELNAQLEPGTPRDQDATGSVPASSRPSPSPSSSTATGSTAIEPDSTVPSASVASSEPRTERRDEGWISWLKTQAWPQGLARSLQRLRARRGGEELG